MSERPTDEQLQIWADGFSSRGHATEIAVECVRLREELKRSQKRIAQLQNDYNTVYSDSMRLFDERAALLKQLAEAEAVRREAEV